MLIVGYKVEHRHVIQGTMHENMGGNVGLVLESTCGGGGDGTTKQHFKADMTFINFFCFLWGR